MSDPTREPGLDAATIERCIEAVRNEHLDSHADDNQVQDDVIYDRAVSDCIRALEALRPSAVAETPVFTAEEADALLRSVRPLDCGALHCRYCPAGSHNGWNHTEYCVYDESMRLVEKARKAIGNHFPTKARRK